MRYHGGGEALRLDEIPRPTPGSGQVLVEVSACGVCRTDLHLIDDELPGGTLPIVPGHEIVGRIRELGREVEGFQVGERVGIPWLASTCGRCSFCSSGRENLCGAARFTGFHVDGGYADYALADARYCFALQGGYSDIEAAPLLCAGLIGYRSYRMAGDAERLGLYGFGAAAHLITQVAVADGRRVHALTRPGDDDAQRFARELGAVWAGGSDEMPPEPLDAAILFAPVGALVPAALRAIEPGGRVVCAGIHMSDIPAFPYRILWQERQLVSVANLTRRDALELLALAPRIPIRCQVTPYPLEQANQALAALRAGELRGAAVLTTRPG
ncbi:MAG: zinc-dependent alcohol dehydrogenase family protein [Deltaproteobacteria bacterium]|nr:zinc-dependent alcohol dehydrogenase family protein [Deltaproteobacteria bacterium]